MSSAVSFRDLSLAARFAASLPLILKRPLRDDEAVEAVRHRREYREEDFLRLVLKSVYRHPGSPYLRLLRHAGCEFEDLRKLVRRAGLEGALGELFRQGVFLTLEEFKGRQNVRRGNLEFSVSFGDFINPFPKPFLPVHSGGSTGSSTAFHTNREYTRERISLHCLVLRARGGLSWDHAVWGIPGHTDLLRVIELAGFGRPPKRWFSQVDSDSPELHPRYRWSARVLTASGNLAGVRIPRPEYVPLSNPLPIVRWMRATLDRGGVPHLITFVTPGLSICRSALDVGLDLSGACLTVGGESLKESHVSLFRRTGLLVVPRFLAAECGYIGYGCLRPEKAGDYHFFDDMLTVVQPGETVSDMDLTPRSLLLTSLRPNAPIVLLNVSLGDEAEIRERGCGCELERLGWTRHVVSVRSLRSITCGGMTFPISAIRDIMENVLPRRFGGTTQDYQLVEEIGVNGIPKMKLRAHPGLGPLDEKELVSVFLEALGSQSEAQRVMALQWKHSDLMDVERKPPLTTAAGKTMPFYKADE